MTNPPRLKLEDGTIEALKWCALVLMTLDHVNKYLFNATLPVAFEVGRLCLPIFVILLAFNLARPGAIERGAYLRTMTRLAVIGALASVPFIALGGLAGGWWPLNILFTLLLITMGLYLIEKGGAVNISLSTVLVLIGGAFVEYWWMAVALGLASWWFFKRPSWFAAAAVVAACASLWFVNGNNWALLALPLIMAVSRLDLSVPRLRWAFYAFYPAHLAALWLIRIPMSKAGYLFF
jgi:hypothetical protein